ncbi:type-F conjugative transfer system pilin assembly protein TraF [Pasteurella multocida]|uniref:type-F conjugative transfer system pilin assembly protein TraF n=1 Tax=Pasteurella multocida TaxID=747 RepID=UPI00147F2F37|nr:type-F conjugative transfer system pilin assembly protein TraF [Pasteurella multocida]NNH97759.1 type-F conjugative transfer system pilin assembly protein TraF [Pasteurella multocida]NNI42898.1 type-F conjugative transfer system pilin assembly protein TraF [Pasteurella multocida]
MNFSKVISIFLSLILFSSFAFSNEDDLKKDKIIGWQFYNLPKKKEKKKEEERVEDANNESTNVTPMEQMKYLQKLLEETKANAIMNPTVENIAVYKTVQDFMVEKASVFSSNWEKMLLEHPQLDYNISNSHYNATAPIKAANERAEQSKAIQIVNQHYGVFFFYRGNEALDNKLSEIIKDFGEQYQLSIFPISVDGRVNATFPHSKIDMGQSEKMGIKYFPALFLVDPKAGDYKPLAYGFITQDDLARRVLNIVTNFKPRI